MVVVENRELPLGEVDLDPYGAPRVLERCLARLHPGDAVVAQRCVPDRDPAAVELHRRKHLRRPELGRVADEAEQAPSGARSASRPPGATRTTRSSGSGSRCRSGLSRSGATASSPSRASQNAAPTASSAATAAAMSASRSLTPTA